jgi:hypothetical protein
MSGGEVAKRDTTPLMRRDPMGLAKHFAASGYFKDATEMSQAVVKIVAGEEVGLGPMASMQGIHIIEGKPSHSANVLATLVKRSEKYDYKVVQSDEKKCRLEFYEDGESAGFAEFTIEQAQKMRTKQRGEWIALADTLRWKNSPEDMLFARAMSRGVRKFAADVTAGAPAYTPEELGAEVDESGEPVFVESEVVEEAAASPALAPEKVEHLAKGYSLATPTLEVHGVNALDGFNLLLGSLGIDGFNPNTPLKDALARLTDEQADALDAELQKLIEAQDNDASEGGESDVA